MRMKRFEDMPYARPPDETDVNLRAYFDAMDVTKLGTVDLDWSDEELRRWDGNFRNDGVLMMVCCDRDVEIDEYRRVLGDFLDFKRATAATSPDQCPA